MCEKVDQTHSREAKRFSLKASTTEGNFEKHDAYREAWKRIKLATEKHFYLEAVTIAESVIADRLLSHLSGVGAKTEKGHKFGLRTNFVEMTKVWMSLPPPVEDESLPKDVDEWRIERNEVVHGIAKSNPGEPTKTVEVFLRKAQDSAIEGEKLARRVCNWHRRELGRRSTRGTEV